MSKATTASALRSELDSLRREIEAIRAGRKTKNGNGDHEFGLDISGLTEQLTNVTDQLRGLAQDVSDFAGDASETVERKVTDHPLTSVIGALAVGILIGRIMHR
jgi:ElaB/YqjD/DUF883 family membrane-anchored ribosome-binding protein